MSKANLYFEILHFRDCDELRPSERLIRSKMQPVGCLLLFLLLLIGFYWWLDDRQLRELWLWGVGLIPIWLIVVYVNRRLRHQATMPLIIAPGPYILHGETILSGEIVFAAVKLGVQKNYDNPDTYNVMLIRENGEPLTLPQPYFGDLHFEEAVLLADVVAKLLLIPFERELQPKHLMG